MRGATGLHFVKVGDIAFQSTLPIRGATLREFLDLMVKRFQSTLLMRGATDGSSCRSSADRFQSTLLIRGATTCYGRLICCARRFQSTLLIRGATTRPAGVPDGSCGFQSTLLMRGATSFMALRSVASVFQSTLLMRGATCILCLHDGTHAISIHAPHARSDLTADRMAVLAGIISIHAPHARSDCRHREVRQLRRPYFNPRSSCEERRPSSRCPNSCRLSIHAPHARSDAGLSMLPGDWRGFQSTLLMRGATSSRSLPPCCRY